MERTNEKGETKIKMTVRELGMREMIVRPDSLAQRKLCLPESWEGREGGPQAWHKVLVV